MKKEKYLFFGLLLVGGISLFILTPGFVERKDDEEPINGKIASEDETSESFKNNVPLQESPTNQKHSFPELWPKPNMDQDDRITTQMDFRPADYSGRVKTILLYNGFMNGGREGMIEFVESECKIQACSLTSNRRLIGKSKMVIFDKPPFSPEILSRSSKQIWMFRTLESPMHTPSLEAFKNSPVNWTATYRRDSTIVTPYEKWVPFQDKVNSTTLKRNYAKGKEGRVAWIVSNCHSSNSRSKYATELQKHFPVDVFGGCGPLRCSDKGYADCEVLLRRKYKFYLAFENSNCMHYITEKFFRLAFDNNVLPIVMGARKEDYEKAAPPNSFLHVEDFPNPSDLARYLTNLDRHDNIYNHHFAWKDTGAFIDTKFWCRTCALLHSGDITAQWVNDLDIWWRKPGVCTRDKWKEETDLVQDFPKNVNNKPKTRRRRDSSLIQAWMAGSLVVLVVFLIAVYICGMQAGAHKKYHRSRKAFYS